MYINFGSGFSDSDLWGKYAVTLKVSNILRSKCSDLEDTLYSDHGSKWSDLGTKCSDLGTNCSDLGTE